MKRMPKDMIRCCTYCAVAMLWGTGCSFSLGNLGYNGPDKYTGDEGEYFDAKIDGTEWYAQYRSGGLMAGPSPIRCYYGHYPGKAYYLFIEITRDNNPSSVVTINLDSMYGIGSYELGDSSHGAWGNYRRIDPTANRNFTTDSLRTGIITIAKIDTVQSLLTGRVNFEAAEGSTIIHLTEGAFIARYQY